MRAELEERRETVERIGFILFRDRLSEEDLAALLNVQPRTVQRWLETGHVDKHCARMLLELIERDPGRILPLLAERAEKSAVKETEDWPGLIATVRDTLGMSDPELYRLVGVSGQVYREYMTGETAPDSCYRVLFEVLHDHPTEMSTLLRGFEEPAPEPEEWTRRRFTDIALRTGLKTTEIERLIGVGPGTISYWVSGRTRPGGCTELLILLLEAFPESISEMLLEADPDPVAAWTGRRVREVNESLGITKRRLAELMGLGYTTLIEWERDGIRAKTRCPAVLYALLEAEPDATLSLIEKLRL